MNVFIKQKYKYLDFDMFLHVTGLFDRRNKRKKLHERLDKEFRNGLIRTDRVVTLANRIYAEGAFWMWPDGHERRLCDVVEFYANR